MATQSPSSDNAGYSGAQDLDSAAGRFNVHDFLISQFVAKLATNDVVQVKAVYSDGGVAPVGVVDVQPMVAQQDGSGNLTPHGTVYSLPYFRLQGGPCALIIDPAVDDIGYVAFCRRDISKVKATKAPAGPGSNRQFDWADGIYVGGILNGAPTTYIQIRDGVLSLVSTNSAAVTAPTVTVNASTSATVTSPHVDLLSNDVNLGGTGGKKVVLDGDPVIGGGGGTVQASSMKVKAV